MTQSHQRAESVPSPTRRQMLRLAPALALAPAMAATPFAAETSDPLDLAVLYAAQRFDAAAEAFHVSGTARVHWPALSAMRACVGALSILPARSPAAIAAKRRVAGWRILRGGMPMSLCAEDRAAILASIERDEGRA